LSKTVVDKKTNNSNNYFNNTIDVTQNKLNTTIAPTDIITEFIKELEVFENGEWSFTYPTTDFNALQATLVFSKNLYELKTVTNLLTTL
jgi:hypothetical protein